MMTNLDEAVATAILGIDTLWGGDVMNPSGMGRFIADSWFSDERLPVAYTHPAAARVRESGGVGEKEDRAAIDAYLREVDVHGSILAVAAEAKKSGGMRGDYLEGLALCFEVMWDLAMELHGTGAPVPYERCVETITGCPPEQSDPAARIARVAELLGHAGYPSEPSKLIASVDAWRRERMVAPKTIPSVAEAFIARFDALTEANLMPYLPDELAEVPRANVRFLPIENAWFSGSMNYLGRARNADGSPQYEASYELNAALEISVPEFQQLVSHEVVPGHVTTFAFLQNLYWRGKVGFEATVLTMNTRGAALFEGLANNAILVAYGVGEPSELPDRDLELGILLALLQDDAKNQSSYLTWKEKLPQKEVAATIRRDFLLSEERAGKLSGAWGRHPLLGRMYLPTYRFGTNVVDRLRRSNPPKRFLPLLYGCEGLVDIITIQKALAS
jgi:hypothetical protein